VSQRERKQLPRAIPRTGADIARAARTAKASSVPAPVSQPTGPTTEPKRPGPGAYVGAIGSNAGEQSPPPFEVFWIPFPGSNRIPPQEGQ
jgi:hypothetical protein